MYTLFAKYKWKKTAAEITVVAYLKTIKYTYTGFTTVTFLRGAV